MQNLIHLLYILFIRKRYYLFVILLFLFSCSNNDHSKETEKLLNRADSLCDLHHWDTTEYLLTEAKKNIDNSNPLIVRYYSIKGKLHYDDKKLFERFADSALTFFTKNQKEKNNKELYASALMFKGDAEYENKQLSHALIFYVESIKHLKDGFKKKKIIGRIGNIYYNQGKYILAARYYANSYLNDNEKAEDEKMTFYLRQGAYHNAALAYQRALLTDSAFYYYFKKAYLIKATKASIQKRKIPDYTLSSEILLYGNLGYLYLKQKRFDSAEYYLTKANAISIRDVDGLRLSPLVKFAHLRILQNRFDEAKSILDTAKPLVDQYGNSNKDLKAEWLRRYSKIMTIKKDYKAAADYQFQYILLQDTLNNIQPSVKEDLKMEPDDFQQLLEVSDLKHNNNVKQLYITAFALLSALLVIIILLYRKNLNNSKHITAITKEHNDKLKQALNDLEKANKNYMQIMRTMAHDLKNPFAGISGIATYLLTEENLTEDNKQMLNLIAKVSTSSVEMIDDLMKSHLQDEKLVVQKSKTNLVSILEDAVGILQFKAKEKNQTIAFEPSTKEIFANVNYEQMLRVCNNVIVNAIKFSYDNSTIQIGIEKNESTKKAIIKIADQGIGIPEEKKHLVFDIFSQAKRAGTNGEIPFGLGLSICKSIIEKHNGRIWFESKAEAGTTFFIELGILDA